MPRRIISNKQTVETRRTDDNVAAPQSAASIIFQAVVFYVVSMLIVYAVYAISHNVLYLQAFEIGVSLGLAALVFGISSFAKFRRHQSFEQRMHDREWLAAIRLKEQMAENMRRAQEDRANYKISEDSFEVIYRFPPPRTVRMVENKEQTAQAVLAPPMPPLAESFMLSSDFAIHANELLSGRGAVIGVSGSGKSNTVADLHEEMGRLGVPCLLLDTENEYQSLCQPEYLPYGRLAGAASVHNYDEAFRFAHHLLDENWQVVFDLSSYSYNDAAMVMVGLISGLKHWQDTHEHVSCMVTLEEAARWLPQNSRESVLDADILAALQTSFFNDVVRTGRKRGIGLILALQRISEVDKRGIQTSFSILHRQTQDRDLTAYERLGIEREQTLSLRDGEGFVSTSKVSNLRVQMRRRLSPHGGETPGLASIRNRTFVQPIEPISVVSPFRQEPAQKEKIIPAEIRKQITQRFNDGMLRTHIQRDLKLNDDQYWMVKQVCDELERQP